MYTPVSRTFGASSGSDDAATTFVWDVFFAAVMFGLAGPEHASSLRARDIAYANIITTVFSRTVTGMVPNYRNGKWDVDFGGPIVTISTALSWMCVGMIAYNFLPSALNVGRYGADLTFPPGHLALSGQGGQTCTYDRTEPMVGSWSLQIVHSVFGDDWPVQLLFPALLGWNQWVWDARTAEGVSRNVVLWTQCPPFRLL